MVEPDPNTVGDAFPPTHWSVVLTAGHGGTEQASEAFAELYRTYWYPIYAYARRTDHSREEAQDLTQGFFEHLWQHHSLLSADPSRGRFRSFLLRCFRNYLGSVHERASSQKRGGASLASPLDADKGEQRFGREPSDESDPERLYERNWAVAVLEEAMSQVRRHFQQSGRAQVFELLQPLLVAEEGSPSYASLAQAMGTTEGTVKSMVHRTRVRYRDALRAVVVQTVESPTEVEGELQHLLNVLER